MDVTTLKGRRVVVGVGGGIAAYKACELVRELSRAGAEVRVAMTESARQFVTPLTFQALSGHPVLTDYFDPAQEGNFGHLDLARWAEVFVVAPATADLLARIRAGMGNDAVTTSLLAFRGPVVLAPAMNVAMWDNPLTQENLAALLAYIDRVARAFVIDFLEVHWFDKATFPSFNVADAAICIGVGMLIIDSFVRKEKPAQAPTQA